MSLVLPSTVEELNYIQNSIQSSQLSFLLKDSSKDFDNLGPSAVRSYKREYSLPNGVNWNVHDFGPYLNFDENNPANNFEVINCHEEQLVPGEELRQRSESISSVTSNMDDKTVVYQNMGIKTYSTVCMDSGSTCISSDHPYVNLTSPPAYKDLESEETFQNLNQYITQGPEVTLNDTISSISSASSPLNDNLDYSVLSNFSAISNNSNDSYSNLSLKRSASPDPDFLNMNSSKRFCESPDSSHYQEVRKKNNIASKHCRKTRKEKQKEMETRVTDLIKEREDLIQRERYLQHMIAHCKKRIHAIMKPPSNGFMGNGAATAVVPNNVLSQN